MKHEQITFRNIVPAEDVLTEFAALGRRMPPRIAMVECKNIVERLVKERAVSLILPQIVEAIECVEMQAMDGSIPSDPESLSDAYDAEIETLLDAYSLSITQDFIGRYCVSTRFHLDTPPGGKTETVVLAEAFAADVWRVLIHDADEDNASHVLQTGQILSAVGIVQSDLVEIMGDLPAGPPKATQKEVKPMREMNEILNELHEFYGGEFNEAEVKGFFEMAIDTDDGLSLSGLVPMGLDVDSAPTLRLFAAKYGKRAPDEFVTAMRGAPYEPDATDSMPDVAVSSVPEIAALADDEETDPEMRELLGLPPLPVALSPAPALPATPAPATPARPRLPAEMPAPGEIDKKVFALIREHVKVKDEDIGAGLGVSRQTFINYGDPKKKTKFIATPEQQQFLIDKLQTTLDGCNEALALLK